MCSSKLWECKYQSGKSMRHLVLGVERDNFGFQCLTLLRCFSDSIDDDNQSLNADKLCVLTLFVGVQVLPKRKKEGQDAHTTLEHTSLWTQTGTDNTKLLWFDCMKQWAVLVGGELLQMHILIHVNAIVMGRPVRISASSALLSQVTWAGLGSPFIQGPELGCALWVTFWSLDSCADLSVNDVDILKPLLVALPTAAQTWCRFRVRLGSWWLPSWPRIPYLLPQRPRLLGASVAAPCPQFLPGWLAHQAPAKDRRALKFQDEAQLQKLISFVSAKWCLNC